jgi:hypothetical protein
LFLTIRVTNRSSGPEAVNASTFCCCRLFSTTGWKLRLSRVKVVSTKEPHATGSHRPEST